jgi:hypothetical protein
LGYPLASTSRTTPPLPGLETVAKASVSTWTASSLMGGEGRVRVRYVRERVQLSPR